MMTKVTIKIEKETHKELVGYLSKMQVKKGKRITIDEAINCLIRGEK